MKFLTVKKSSLFAILVATMMILCAFIVAIPADRTNAANDDGNTESKDRIDIDFTRLDIQRLSGIYAVSYIETPLEKYTYSEADAVIIGKDGKETVNVSDLLEKIEGKNILVIRNGSEVIFDKTEDKEYNELDIKDIVVENGAVFDATNLSGTGGLGDLGIMKTEKLVVDGVVIAEGSKLMVKGEATVSSLDKSGSETLHFAFDVTEEGGLTFSNKAIEDGTNSEWNLVIGGNYDHVSAHGAEYNVTFDTTKKYDGSFGDLTRSTLRNLYGNTGTYVDDYDITFKVADLHGSVRSGNEPQPSTDDAGTTEPPTSASGTPAEPPEPEYSARFDATNLLLTMTNTNEDTGEINHLLKVHYQIDEYKYTDADKEKGSSIEVTFDNLSMNLEASEESIEDASINFDKFEETTTDTDGEEEISAKGFHIKFKIEDIREDHRFAMAILEIIKAKKITKENVGKIADNLVGFSMEFSADSFEYVSSTPDETNSDGAEISLEYADFIVSVDKQGMLTFTSGIPDEKFYLADTVDITMTVGDIVYKVYSDNPSFNLNNVNVAKILKYIVGNDLSNALHGGFVDVICDMMTKQVLDGTVIALKSKEFLIGYTINTTETTQQVSVQIGEEDFEISSVVLGFTGTTVEIGTDLKQLKVNTYEKINDNSNSSEFSILDVKFKIGFEPQGIEEFAKLIKKTASSEFGFSDVLEYYRTVLNTEKAISWSSEPFTFADLEYTIDDRLDEDHFADITVMISKSEETTDEQSGTDIIFSMSHDKDTNEISAEFKNNAELNYYYFVADGYEPDINSSEIKNFKITGLNKASLDNGNKVVSFDIIGLFDAGSETQEADSHAHFVYLNKVSPQLSVNDIKKIAEEDIPLWKTAIDADPEQYFRIEGYHGDLITKAVEDEGITVYFPVSISYGHFDEDLCITYKLSDGEKKVLVPDTVSAKDQIVAEFVAEEKGNFIIYTDGEEHKAEVSINFILKAGGLENIDEVSATCTKDGIQAHKQCTVATCSKKYIDNGKEVTDEQLIIPALGHKAEPIPAIPATKENEGLTAGSICSVCQETLVEQKTVPMLPADATKTTIDTAEGAVKIEMNNLNNIIKDDLILEIKNKKVTTDLSSKIISYLKDNYGGDFQLNLENYSDNSKIENVKIKEALKDSNMIISFDLRMNNTIKHELGSNAIINLDYILPSDKKASNLYIVYADDDGNLNKIDSTYKNNTITFETDHFSYYAVMFEENDATDGLGVAAWIAVATVIVLALALLAMGLRNTSKKD